MVTDTTTTASSGHNVVILALLPLGIALNLAIGTVVHTVKAPVYLDAVGTIVITLLAGARAGIIVGVASFMLGGILTNPVLPWFSGTQAAIAIYTHLAARHGGFRTAGRTILTGIGLGIVAGAVSAPVITYLFAGVTGSGASLIVAFLLASGRGLIKSVVLSGLAAEPLDKTLQCLLAIWIVRGLPRRAMQMFDNPSLRQSGI